MGAGGNDDCQTEGCCKAKQTSANLALSVSLIEAASFFTSFNGFVYSSVHDNHLSAFHIYGIYDFRTCPYAFE